MQTVKAPTLRGGGGGLGGRGFQLVSKSSNSKLLSLPQSPTYPSPFLCSHVSVLTDLENTSEACVTGLVPEKDHVLRNKYVIITIIQSAHRWDCHTAREWWKPACTPRDPDRSKASRFSSLPPHPPPSYSHCVDDTSTRGHHPAHKYVY